MPEPGVKDCCNPANSNPLPLLPPSSVISLVISLSTSFSTIRTQAKVAAKLITNSTELSPWPLPVSAIAVRAVITPNPANTPLTILIVWEICFKFWDNSILVANCPSLLMNPKSSSLMEEGSVLWFLTSNQ